MQLLCTTQTGIPNNILIARTLACTSESRSIVLEVTNISLTPTKINKGKQLGTFILMDEICVINSVQDNHKYRGGVTRKLSEFDLTEKDLSLSQQQELLKLLAAYSTIFATTEEPLGKTSVIKTESRLQYLPYVNVAKNTRVLEAIGGSRG